jgi:hypothetical protein
MPKNFRLTPPLEIVNLFLKACGLKSIHDKAWFSKQHILLDLFEENLPFLEPFYIPCKATEYLYKSLTHKSAITILRQILREHNVSLLSKEKTRTSDKQIWYQLQHNQPSPSLTALSDQEVLIDFS